MDDDYERLNAQEWQSSTPHRQKKADVPPGLSKKPAYVQRSPMKPQHAPATARRNDKRNLRNAKSAWQVAEGVKQRQTSHQGQQQGQQQVLLIDLGDGVEHSAEAAWRRHEPPLASISVPDELVWRDQQHETIARKFGTFVTSQERSGTVGAITLHIWGEPDAVKHTRQAIHNWVQRESPSKHVLGKGTFSKTRSLIPFQRRNEEKRWAREVKRQRFRQFPPLGTVFGAIGTFHWPVQEYQPHEVLGNNYEALDPIRMECSCYVVFQKSIPGFEVMGGIDDVKNALIRLRKACFQIAARQIAPVRKYFLLFGDAGGEAPSTVVLQQFDLLKVVATNGDTVHQPPAKSPRRGDVNQNGPTEEEVLTKSLRDVKISGRSIMLMLAKLHYYRGHIKFRIRLGTFLATHYMSAEDDTYEIDDFQEMLKQSPFRGEVTHEIGKRCSEDTALKTLQSANDVLFPCDSTVRSLVEVKPIYTATFVLADNGGNMQLDISWYEMKDGKKTTLEPLSRRWTRLDRDTTSATSLLDIALINVSRGCAWQFDILATQVVEANRMKPDFEHFADGVRINPEIALKQRTDQPFARWSPYARVKKMQQRVSYQFGLANSDYTLELSRFQDRVFTHKSAMPGDVKSQTYEPRWSLEVWHNEWDKMLTMNEHLDVGAMADWEDGVRTWFPEDDVPSEFGQVKGEKGFEQLISKLTMIEELVLKPDPEMVGGMEVG